MRPIPDAPRYLINEDGTRVIGPGGGRWPKGRDLTISLSPPRHGSQYLRVKIENRYRMIHHLVALTYIGPRPPGLQVRHLDSSYLNNHWTNLAYGTGVENASDSIAAGTHISVQGKAKTQCPQQHEYTPENTYVYRGSRQCIACKREGTRRWRQGLTSS